jgi:proline dehydrogenase
MLRALLIYLSKAGWARRIVTGWSFAWNAASRFVAGNTADDALRAITKLNQEGLFATVDHLGEGVTNTEEAIRATDDYILIMERIAQTGVQSNASLKLTQLGLNIDFDLCLNNMRCILRRAREFGILVRIDIEDSATIDRTWEVFHTLMNEGFSNVGVALQAYLYRSLDDMKALLDGGAHIRICKGAYKEPAEIAFPRKKQVDENFDLLTKTILDFTKANGAPPASPDGKVPPIPAIATHDEDRIEYAVEYATQIGLPNEAVEFQMLHGIRSDLQRQLAGDGYPVRVYIPYGTEWYPYFMRRLAERPANLWFFLSNFIRG